jgi:hypothetical protein
MADVVVDTTALWDAGTKSETQGVKGLETITDNPMSPANAIELARRDGDAFGTNDADAETFRWTALYYLCPALGCTDGSADIGITTAGKLRVKLVNPPGFTIFASRTLVSFSGDFVIEVDLSVLLTLPSGCSAGIEIIKDFTVNDDRVFLTKADNGGVQSIQVGSVWNGNPGPTNYIPHAGTAYKLKVERIGTTVKAYYDPGGGYILADTTTNADIDNLYVMLYVAGPAATTTWGDFNDFKLTSGTVVGTASLTTAGVTWTSPTRTMAANSRMLKWVGTFAGLSAGRNIAKIEWKVAGVVKAAYAPVGGIQSGTSKTIFNGDLTSGSFLGLTANYTTIITVAGDGTDGLKVTTYEETFTPIVGVRVAITHPPLTRVPITHPNLVRVAI